MERVEDVGGLSVELVGALPWCGRIWRAEAGKEGHTIGWVTTPSDLRPDTPEPPSSAPRKLRLSLEAVGLHARDAELRDIWDNDQVPYEDALLTIQQTCFVNDIVG